MARQATTTSRLFVAVVLAFCVIGTSLAVWGLGAQNRVSSDLYDIRNPGLEPATDTMEGHALWALEIVNGRVVTNAELTTRLSAAMLSIVPTDQIIGDVNFLRRAGPFELRGVEIGELGVLTTALRAPNGEVTTLMISPSPDPQRMDGLLFRPGEADRGPFQPVEAVLHLVAGWGLLLSGAAMWLLRHRPRPGQFLMLAGVFWTSQLLELSDTAVLYTLGLVAGPIAAAVTAIALVSFDSRFDKRELGVVLVVVAALLAVLSPLLAIDTSVAALPDQLLSVTHDRDLATLLQAVGQGFTMLAVLVLAALLFIRQRGGTGLGAQQRAALAGVGAAIALFIGALAIWGLTGDHHDLSQSPLVSVAALVVPIGLGFAAITESRFALDGVASMVADVGEQPSRSGLQASLAQALGDPTVKLAFWSNEQQVYLTSTGRPISLEATPEQAVTLVGEGSDRLGAVLHDPALLAEPERVQAAAGATRIAIENERRKAVAAAELRASRARIAESADDARRSVERDLHDGAQQRLIAMQLSLKLEQQRAARAGEQVDPAFLEILTEELGGAIEELRELGRGLRPSALDHGLRTAVESLAERSPLPIVTEITAERVDPTIEAAAYFVINESVANATRYSGADHIRVGVTPDGDELVVTIADDGQGGAVITGSGDGTGLQSLEDRVLALDGRLSVASPAGQGTLVTATLPIGSESE